MSSLAPSRRSPRARAVFTTALGLVLYSANMADAGVISASSKPVQVDLYPQGAIITREAVIDLPAGASTVLLDDLPSDIEGNLIQIWSTGPNPVLLRDIRPGQTPFEPQAEPELVKLEAAVLAKRTEVEQLDTQLSLLREQQDYARKLADAVATHSGKDDERKPGEVVEGARQAWDFVNQTVVEARRRIAELRTQQPRLASELARLEYERDQVRQRLAQLTGQLQLQAELDKPGALTLRVSHRLHQASWSPRYEVRADTAGGKLAWLYQAEIWQQSPEDWKAVDLRVHTGQPARGDALPELPPLYLNRQEAVVMDSYAAGSKARESAPRAKAMALELASSPAPEPVQVAAGRASFELSLPRAVSIPRWSQGSASTILTLLAAESPAQFRSEVRPALDLRGYLVAETKNPFSLPLLPGAIQTYIDGQPAARIVASEQQPGAESTLSLGIDEQIKVERRLGEQKDGERGFIGKDALLRRHVITEITSHHRQPVTVRVGEQFPVSQNEAISVKRLAPGPKEAVFPPPPAPDEGLFHREFTLAPGAQRSLETRYEVRHPKDWEVPGI